MSDLETKRPWIGLNLCLTPRQILLLLGHFESAQAAWGASKAELESVPGFSADAETFVQRRSQAPLERELEALQRHGLHLLTLADPQYPPPLRQLKAPPPVLYARGDYQARDQLALAVVGTRRATAYGRRVAETLTRALAAGGLTVISGLALGIDTIAHQSALAAGGRTVAVLGSGLLCVYPPRNRALAERISCCGALLSEFPLFTSPAPWTFPRRNRVISGLSRGVLVVEAPLKSGALITAKTALDQGRDVFAVPGAITHPNAQGCHSLIKNGAKLIEDATDVLEEFPELAGLLQKVADRPRTPPPPLNDEQRRVLEALDFEPTHINALIESLGLGAAHVSAALVELEMLGLVSETEGKHYVKLP